MTKDEVKTLYSLIRASFSSFYQKHTDIDMIGTITVWTEVFRNDPKELVEQALIEYIRTSTSGYPPNPAQLRELMPTMNPKGMSSEEAWQMALRACTHHEDEAKKRFMKLPQDVQDALGGHSVLVSIALTLLSELQWKRKEFIQRYEAIRHEAKLMVQRGRWQIEYAEAKNQLPKETILSISCNGHLLPEGHRLLEEKKDD